MRLLNNSPLLDTFSSMPTPKEACCALHSPDIGPVLIPNVAQRSLVRAGFGLRCALRERCDETVPSGALRIPHAGRRPAPQALAAAPTKTHVPSVKKPGQLTYPNRVDTPSSGNFYLRLGLFLSPLIGFSPYPRCRQAAPKRPTSITPIPPQSRLISGLYRIFTDTKASGLRRFLMRKCTFRAAGSIRSTLTLSP